MGGRGMKQQTCPTHGLPMEEPFMLESYRNGWMCPLCRDEYIEKIKRSALERLLLEEAEAMA